MAEKKKRRSLNTFVILLVVLLAVSIVTWIASGQTYTVKSGDNLWNIAKQHYGSGAMYTKIYEANKDLIGGNPNLIFPGQKLIIP